MGLEMMSAADIAITGNGTVSLESQLLQLPHIALAHSLYSKNICNSIANETIVPEFPFNAAPEIIAAKISDCLGSETILAAMREKMARQKPFFQSYAAEVAAHSIELLAGQWRKKEG